MSIILIALVALVAGFVLIAFISKAAPSASALAEASGDNWIARLSPEEFQRLLSSLFGEMKFEVESCSLRGGDVDLFAVNPTPITGARIYVRGVFHPPLGMVGEDEVRIALETARAEMAGKAIVVTPGAFTPDAKASAKGTPVDLLDGAALLALVKKHLPQIAAERRM
jgi:hypothetical protein